MFIQKIKKIVATLLILSLVLTSTGFSVFADSVNGTMYESATGSEIKKHYNESTLSEMDKEDDEEDKDKKKSLVSEPEEDDTASKSQTDEEDDSRDTKKSGYTDEPDEATSSEYSGSFNEEEDDETASPSQADGENISHEATESEFTGGAYEETESELASESEIEISTNSRIKTKDENLFGAPPDYTLPNSWSSVLSTTERQSATEIAFIKGSYTPPAGASNYPIPNSDGLIAYYEPANRVVIHAPTNNTIYASADASRLFYDFYAIVNITNLSYLNTSNVATMSYMFYGCRSLTSLDLSNFNTSNVTSMREMFGVCVSLASLDLSNFNTSNVTNMDSMFNGCGSLTNLDLSNFNTSNVTLMEGVFHSCSSLTSLDLSNFNTSNVTHMDAMFFNCSSLTNLDLSSFNTSNVTIMYYMFNGCSSLTNLDLSSFNTSNVTNMGYMFSGCTALIRLDLSNFNTSNVINMRSMFNSCSVLSRIIVSADFTTTRVTSSDWMFHNCSVLKGCQCTTLASVSYTDDKTYARIDGGVSNPGLLYDSNPGPVTLPNEIFVGTYEQAGGSLWRVNIPAVASDRVSSWNRQPVKWKVLFQDGYEALLMTDLAIEYSYLGGDISFSTQELNAIKDTTVITPGEPTVVSKLFELSVDELNTFLPTDISRRAKGSPLFDGSHSSQSTRYPSSIVGSLLVHEYFTCKDCNWGLRGTTSIVDTNGRLVSGSTERKRYAMYVDLNSPPFSNDICNITWDFGGSSVVYVDSFAKNWTSYIEGVNYKLPTNGYIARSHNTDFLGNASYSYEYNSPEIGGESELLGFYIDTDSSKGTTIMTEIPGTQRGDITLRAVWKSNLVFDLRGEGTWDSSFTPPSSFVEGEKIVLPSSASIIANIVGRELDCWKVEPAFYCRGNDIMPLNWRQYHYWDTDPDIGRIVDENYTKNRKLTLTLGAYFKNSKYDIKYNLGEGSFEDGYVAPAKYEFSVGLDLSQVINHINPPENKKVDYIKVNGVRAASISTTTTGTVTVDVVYKSMEYPITWELNGSKWATGYVGTSSYIYGEGLVLPEATKLVLPDKKEFLCWAVNGKREEEISKTCTGAVTVTVIYTDTKTYSITWNLRGGHFIDYDAPDVYYEGVEYILPDGTEKVAPPKNLAFEQWVLNSAKAITKIEKTSRGAVIIETQYKKISGGGSSTGGGGGRSGGAGGGYVNQLNNNLNFVLRTPIYENEYTWKYDDTGNKVGLSLDANSLVAKAMMNSDAMKAAYSLSSDCKSIDIGGGGVYNIVEKGFNSFYGFDSKFKLMTGFIYTSERTKILDVVESAVYGLGKTENNGEKKVFFEQPHTEGKYYLFEDVGYYKGLLWNQPVVVGGYLYRFDVTGKVISTSDINVYQGFWEYNIGINKWRFLGVDRDGKVGYYKNGVYDILYDKEVLKYGFDSEGNVLTGTYELNGKTYTAYSTGAHAGAIIYD